MEHTEIKDRIEQAIHEGVDPEFMTIVRELKAHYYMEDVAAAALALYAKGGLSEGVHRRTLQHVPFVPLKTAERKAPEKKRPARHTPTPPVASAKVHHEKPARPAHGKPGGQHSRPAGGRPESRQSRPAGSRSGGRQAHDERGFQRRKK